MRLASNSPSSITGRMFAVRLARWQVAPGIIEHSRHPPRRRRCALASRNAGESPKYERFLYSVQVDPRRPATFVSGQLGHATTRCRSKGKSIDNLGDGALYGGASPSDWGQVGIVALHQTYLGSPSRMRITTQARPWTEQKVPSLQRVGRSHCRDRREGRGAVVNFTRKSQVPMPSLGPRSRRPLTICTRIRPVAAPKRIPRLDKLIAVHDVPGIAANSIAPSILISAPTPRLSSGGARSSNLL